MERKTNPGNGRKPVGEARGPRGGRALSLRRDSAPAPLASPTPADAAAGSGAAAPHRQPAGAVLRSGVRRRGQHRLGAAAPRAQPCGLPARDHVVRDGVLRDLVGVDELHVVRDLVRHGRLAVPRHHVRADGRRARAGRGHPARLRRGRLHAPGHRLRRDAHRDGRAVAAGLPLGGPAAGGDTPLCPRHRGGPGAVAPVPPGSRRGTAARRLRRLRAHRGEHPRVRRAPSPDAVASAPCHGEVRAVHPDRARREPARLGQRHHRGSRRRCRRWHR